MNRRGSIRVDAAALAACAALTALVYAAAVRPALGSRARATENYQQYQSRTKQVDDLGRKAAELEASAAGLRKKIDASPVRLRSIMEVNAVLDELANMAKAHHVEINQISSGDAVQGAVLAMAPLKISATGSFPDVLSFLTEMEHGRPEIATIKFAIDADREAEETGSENAGTPGSRTRLTLNLEWYAEPTGAGAKSGAAPAGTPGK